MAKKTMTTLAAVTALALMIPASAGAEDDPVEFPDDAKHIQANGTEVLNLTWESDGTPKLAAKDSDGNVINPNNYVFDLPSMKSDKAKDKSGDINILTMPRVDNTMDIFGVGKTGEKYPAAMFWNGQDMNVTSTFDTPPENINPNDVYLKLEEVQGPSWVDIFQYRPTYAYNKWMLSSWHPNRKNYNFKNKFDMKPNFVFGKPGDYQISFSVRAYDSDSKEFKSNTITQNWHVTAGAPAKPKPEPEPTPTNTPTPDPEPSNTAEPDTPTKTDTPAPTPAPSDPKDTTSTTAPSPSSPSKSTTPSDKSSNAPTSSSKPSKSTDSSSAPSSNASPDSSSDDVWPSDHDAALPPSGGDSSGPGNDGNSSSSGSNGGLYDTPAYVEEIGSSNSGTVGLTTGSTSNGGDSSTSATNVSDGGSPGLSVSSVPVDDGTTSEIPTSDLSGGDTGDSANIAPDVEGASDSNDSGDLGVDSGDGKQAAGGSNSNVTAYEGKKGKLPAKIAGVSSWAVGAAIVMLTGASALAGLMFARRRDEQVAPAGAATAGPVTTGEHSSTTSNYDDVNFRKES